MTLLLISFWRGVKTIVDEVRRAPTWVLATMLLVVVMGTLIAQLAR